MSYNYDVFISHSSHGMARRWTTEVFVPTFTHQFAVYHQRSRIFHDGAGEPGVAWGGVHGEALASSRVLVCVLDNSFLRSIWCNVELRTFIEREKLTGAHLVLPVTFIGIGNLARGVEDELWTHQLYDLSEFNSYLVHASRRSTTFRRFERAVGRIAMKAAELANAAPAWSPMFPLVRPDSVSVPVRSLQPRS